MAKILCNLKDLSREEWLEKRLHSIGGSEAAAALGVDKHTSGLELWSRKTGKWNFTEDKDSERKRLGRDLEGYAAERFSEATGKRIGVPEHMYVHDEFDFLTANPDREIVGENAALECVTVNSAFEKIPEKVSELPQNILAQCYHYLAVMNFEKIYLALLDLFSGELKIFEIPYDEEKCGKLLETEISFWNDHVISGIPPEPDGSDSAEEALKRLAEPVHGEPVDLNNYSEQVNELFELRRKIKDSETLEKKLRQEIILAMDGNSAAFTEKYRLNFSKQNRKTVDTKVLKEDHAEIYEKCLKNSMANILKISEI